MQGQRLRAQGSSGALSQAATISTYTRLPSVSPRPPPHMGVMPHIQLHAAHIQLCLQACFLGTARVWYTTQVSNVCLFLEHELLYLGTSQHAFACWGWHSLLER